MTLNYNPPQTIPSLIDLLGLLRKDILLSFNAHAIGVIQEFFCPTVLSGETVNRATASIQISYNRTVSDSDGNQSTVMYPLLLNVPVVSLCGGSTTLTLPIAKGDQCLLLFNDRDIDNWFSGAQSGEVNSNRLHSLSDGVALVGLNNLSSYDTVRALLTNGTVKLGINPNSNKVTITNGISLGTILSDLATGLGQVATHLQANPTGEPAAYAAGLLLASYASSFGSSVNALLE